MTSSNKKELINSIVLLTIYLTFVYFYRPIITPSIQLLFSSKYNNTYINIIFLFLILVVSIIGIYLFLDRLKSSWLSTSLKKDILWVILFVITGHIMITLPFPTDASMSEMSFLSIGESLKGWEIVLFISVLIFFAPLLDSLIYSEIMVNVLSPYTTSVIAILTSSLLYSSIHVDNYSNWMVAIPYFCTSFVINILFIVSKKNISALIIGRIIDTTIGFLMMI